MMFTYNNQMKPRRRHPSLYFYRDGQVVLFRGESIPKVCKVLSTKSEKAGIWSYTKYDIEVGSWIPVEVCRPFNGWGQSYKDIHRGFTSPVDGYKVPEEVFRAVLSFMRENGLVSTGLNDALQQADLAEGIELE